MSPRQAVAKDCCISPLEKYTQPAPKVGDCLCLVLSRVPGKSDTQLLHRPLSTRVPTPKGLRHKRLEGNPLPPALLCSTIHFAAIGEVKGMPTGRSRTCLKLNIETSKRELKTLFLYYVITLLSQNFRPTILGCI